MRFSIFLSWVMKLSAISVKARVASAVRTTVIMCTGRTEGVTEILPATPVDCSPIALPPRDVRPGDRWQAAWSRNVEAGHQRLITPITSDTRKSARNTKNRIFATSAAQAAMPLEAEHRGDDSDDEDR